VTAPDPHVCPSCRVRGAVPLLPDTVCPACQATEAWTRYADSTLVIGTDDIAAAVARRRDARPALGGRLLALLPLVLGAVLAAGAGLAARALLSRRGPAGLAAILENERRALALLAGYALVVVGAGVPGALGAMGWYEMAGGFALEHLAMPARLPFGEGAVDRIQAATAIVVSGDEDGDFSSPRLGTGSIIAADAARAWIVTCSHVAMPYVSPGAWRDPATARPVWVELSDGRAAVGTVSWTARPPLDVALVEVHVADPPRPVAIAAGSTHATASADVLFVPNPLRLGWLVHRGQVVKRESHDTPAGDYSLLFTDLPVQPGDSGSGLFDAAGAIVGLNTWAGLTPGAPRGISLPAEVMRQMVDSIRAEHPGTMAQEGDP
jgi:S1-C subfamily serine protease